MTDATPIRADAVPLRPAATVMLLRDAAAGLEVFMLQRTHGASFARGMYVFPGGKVDEADHAGVFEPISDGLDDATASARLGVERGGLAWLVAAIRECFEEAGVLLARRADQADAIRFDDPAVEAAFEIARHAIHDGERSLVDLCDTDDLRLLVDRIHFVDHWITPIGEPRRFDTRFFVAEAPRHQRPLHDDKETIDSRWTRPADALAAWEAREIGMFPPTIASLRWLDGFATVAEVIESAVRLPLPTPILPRLLLDGTGRIVGVRRPDEPGYDDTPIPDYVLSFTR